MKKIYLYIVLSSFLFLSVQAQSLNVLGGLERFVSIAPGGKYEGTILLSNNSASPRWVKIYQTDYRFNHKGENYFDNPGTLERSNSPWIKFAPERLLIEANKTAKVDYTVQVPEKSDLKGVYWCLLMIEPQMDDDPELLSPSQQGMKVRTVSRYAVQILTTIGKAPQGLEGFKFLDRQIVDQGDKRFFEINAQNNGLFYMRPTMWAEFFDAKGRSVGRFPGGAPQILPGCSVKYRVDVTGLPDGDYEALVVVDTGQDNVTGAKYKVKIE